MAKNIAWRSGGVSFSIKSGRRIKSISAANIKRHQQWRLSLIAKSSMAQREKHHQKQENKYQRRGVIWRALAHVIEEAAKKRIIVAAAWRKISMAAHGACSPSCIMAWHQRQRSVAHQHGMARVMASYQSCAWQRAYQRKIVWRQHQRNRVASGGIQRGIKRVARAAYRSCAVNGISRGGKKWRSGA